MYYRGVDTISRMRRVMMEGFAAERTELNAERDALTQQLQNITRDRDEYAHACAELQDAKSVLDAELIFVRKERDAALERERVYRDVLESLHVRHHQECEDSWYSCPKAKDYIAHNDFDDEPECDCGMIETNALIDSVLAQEVT